MLFIQAHECINHLGLSFLDALIGEVTDDKNMNLTKVLIEKERTQIKDTYLLSLHNKNRPKLLGQTIYLRTRAKYISNIPLVLSDNAPAIPALPSRRHRVPPSWHPHVFLSHGYGALRDDTNRPHDREQRRCYTT